MSHPNICTLRCSSTPNQPLVCQKAIPRRAQGKLMYTFNQKSPLSISVQNTILETRGSLPSIGSFFVPSPSVGPSVNPSATSLLLHICLGGSKYRRLEDHQNSKIEHIGPSDEEVSWQHDTPTCHLAGACQCPNLPNACHGEKIVVCEPEVFVGPTFV